MRLDNENGFMEVTLITAEPTGDLTPGKQYAKVQTANPAIAADYVYLTRREVLVAVEMLLDIASRME